MNKSAVSEQRNQLLRVIPSIEELLQFSSITALLDQFPRPMVVEATRRTLESLRQRIKSLDKKEMPDFSIPDKAKLFAEIEKSLRKKTMPLFCKVINAAGIVLHTALGRAMLAPAVLEAFNKHLSGYTRLATDLSTGKRKSRDTIIEELICEITGAEAATVVNNNAAATVLLLSTLVKGKEVICSRGQMVEIGGSFRIPEIMETSGARLVSVGATNRTHLKDYEKAITKETGALLRVHNSNFRIIGFTAEVPIDELVKLGHKRRLLVIDDLGSGALVDLQSYGLGDEPLVATSVKAGADVICFSADKLIGGPQGGIIIGKKKYIELIRKNPLMRALRVGKLSLVALEATLKLFRDKDTLLKTHPTLRMLTADVKTIGGRATVLMNDLRESVPSLGIKVLDEYSQPGSGSLAGYNIPTKVLAIKANTISSKELAERLRLREVPIFTRLKDDHVLFDMRTVQSGEEPEIVQALQVIMEAK
ncbi:MAG: L-seryl-tRNA(Sec) selenium transferase [Planctomycetota bacterium]